MQHFGRDGSAVGRESRRKLATTLETVFSEAVYDYPALQQDVCEYVRDLKTSGMSAQNVIVTTRNLVMETAGGAPLPDRIEKLLTKMLGWCLEEYYKESA